MSSTCFGASSYRHRILRVLLYMEESIRPSAASRAAGAKGNGALMREELSGGVPSGDALSLETLASVACLSPYHFHRVFTGMVGESVKAYIRRLRLERASTMLAYTDHPIMDVALESGYESQEAFTRAFKARFGSSPAQYRKSGCRLAPSNPYIQEHFMPDNREFSPEALGLHVEIKKLPTLRVAAVRHVGPYNECGTAWKTLCGWAGAKGLFSEAPTLLGVGYDDPAVTDPAKIRYDACIVLPQGVEAGEPVSELYVRGGDYAVAVHKGPYLNLYKSYAALCGQWIPASGREMAMDPCVEVYLNDPERTAPEELLTEIRIPLAE